MSDTNVKVKASSTRNRQNADSPKQMEEKLTKIATKVSNQQSDTHDVTHDASNNNEAKSNILKKAESESMPLMNKFNKDVKPYIKKHSHAFAYGAIGLIVAILILTIGFGPVLLLAVLAAIGITIGRHRDGDTRMLAQARSVANRIRR